MNILFFGDPNSIHDEKWISYFSYNTSNNTYILPRARHVTDKITGSQKSGAILLGPIDDFSIVRFYNTLTTAFRIKAIIKKHRIDLIHILYAEPNALWCIFRNFFGIPMIISTRGTDVLKTIPQAFARNNNLINRLVGPAYKKAFKNSDWVTGTSLKQLESVSLFSGRREKISIIRTGVDLEQLKLRSELPPVLSNTSSFILFPRYIQTVYNHEFCLEAIAQLPLDVSSKFTMVFLGRNNGDSAYQEVLEQKMKAIKNVAFVFLEKQSQATLFELYRNASLVVMTPRSDGSPVSAMEALLCGTKLILGPLQYDDIFSEAAIILKHWSAKELAETITSALTEPGKIEIPAALRELMSREFNMRKMETIYENVFLHK